MNSQQPAQRSAEIAELQSIRDRLFMRISGPDTHLLRARIQSASDTQDLPLLRVFLRVLKRDSSARVVEQVFHMLRHSGVDPETLTQEHLDAYQRLKEALSSALGSGTVDATGIAKMMFADMRCEPFILSLILDRQITDAGTLRQMLEERASVHPSLDPGVL